MKRFFLAILVTVAVNLAVAQNIKAFVTAGCNASQIDGDEVYGFEKFGFTGSVGALIPLDKSRRWNTSVEAMFSQRGAKGSIRTGDLFDYKVTLPYIEIPILAHFTDSKGGWTFGAGFSYSRLLGAPKENYSAGRSGYSPDFNVAYSKNDWSVIADIRFRIWRGLKFNFRYQYSMAPIKKDWNFHETLQNGEDKIWIRDAYSNTITARLIWVFNDEEPRNRK